MGLTSRNKGKRGELDLAHELQQLGFRAVRRSQQYCGSATSADLIGLPKIHIECKRTESLSIYQALDQAIKDSTGSADVPAVMHRRNHRPWVVIMRLSDWANLYRAYAQKM